MIDDHLATQLRLAIARAGTADTRSELIADLNRAIYDFAWKFHEPADEELTSMDAVVQAADGHRARVARIDVSDLSQDRRSRLTVERGGA